MIYFFYFFRNILGSIMVISPFIGFLYIDFNFTLSMTFLCSMLIGLPLGAYCYELINFKLWTLVYSLTASAGAFLSALSAISVLSASPSIRHADYAGAILLGLTFSGLCLILPANIIVNWFRASKTTVMATVWTLSLLLGLAFRVIMNRVIMNRVIMDRIIMERYTYFSIMGALFIMLLIMVAGTIIFLQQPPHLPGDNFVEYSKFHSGKRKVSGVKVFAFIFCISFALGISYALTPRQSVGNSLISPQVMFLLGVVAGPVVSGLLSDFKGVFSGCILLIFLAEIAISCAGFGFHNANMVCLSRLSYGLCLSSLLEIIPVLTYYICGPHGYNLQLCRIFMALPAGFIFTLPVIYNSGEFASSFNILSGAVLIILVLSFFTIFSAWKHRLILLKS